MESWGDNPSQKRRKYELTRWSPVVKEPGSGDWGGGADADSNPACGVAGRGQLQLVLAAATSPRRGRLEMSLGVTAR